jgi:hypothetical protein
VLKKITISSPPHTHTHKEKAEQCFFFFFFPFTGLSRLNYSIEYHTSHLIFEVQNLLRAQKRGDIEAVGSGKNEIESGKLEEFKW